MDDIVMRLEIMLRAETGQKWSVGRVGRARDGRNGVIYQAYRREKGVIVETRDGFVEGEVNDLLTGGGLAGNRAASRDEAF